MIYFHSRLLKMRMHLHKVHWRHLVDTAAFGWGEINGILLRMYICIIITISVMLRKADFLQSVTETLRGLKRQ